MTSPQKTTVSSHDFRNGQVIQVPRELRHPLLDGLKALLLMSHQQRALVPLESTPFRLYADLSTLGDGNAFFVVDTLMTLGAGHVPADTILYTGATACQLATAPLAWRGVMQRYIKYAALAPLGNTLGAPSLMPRSMPWICGFSRRGHDYLTKAEREILYTVLQLAGLTLLRQCEDAVRQAAQRGALPIADPVQFPELIDWDI